MRTWTLVTALLVSGCVAPPAAPPVDAPGLPCPAYPDATAIDCDANLLRAEGIAPTAPGPETGWLCVLRHRDDRGLGVFDMYVHQDGRLAYAWDLNVQRQGGTLVAHASVYQGEGSQFLVAKYQPKGFAVLPQKKSGDTAVVHLFVRQVQLDQKLGETWAPVDAQLLIGSFKKDAWYVLGFDAGRGREYIAPMHPDAAPRFYQPDDALIQEPDRELFVDVWIAGAKFTSANLGWPSLGNSRCHL